MMANSTYDPWNSAWEAQPRVYSNEVFGDVTIAMEPVVLIKGVGKVPFDATVHKEEDRRTSITITITPLPESKFTDAMTRDMLAESNDWTKITLPSVKALGVSGLRDLYGKYVKAKMIPTGQKFVGRDGNEREKTAFSFIAVYQSEQDCRGAFNAANSTSDDDVPFDTTPATGAGSNPERETALKFLPPIVENCCRGAASKADAKAKVVAAIAGMPMVNRFFTADSPEVGSLIDKIMGV